MLNRFGYFGLLFGFCKRSCLQQRGKRKKGSKGRRERGGKEEGRREEGRKEGRKGGGKKGRREGRKEGRKEERKNSPDDDAVINGEAIIGQPCNVPLPDLDLVSKCGTQRELVRAGDASLLTHTAPLLNLVLERTQYSRCYQEFITLDATDGINITLHLVAANLVAKLLTVQILIRDMCLLV